METRLRNTLAQMHLIRFSLEKVYTGSYLKLQGVQGGVVSCEIRAITHSLVGLILSEINNITFSEEPGITHEKYIL